MVCSQIFNILNFLVRQKKIGTSIFQLLDFDPIAALRDSDGNGKSMEGIVNITRQDTFKV